MDTREVLLAAKVGLLQTLRQVEAQLRELDSRGRLNGHTGRRGFTAAQRREQSLRMREYWRQRKAGRKARRDAVR